MSERQIVRIIYSFIHIDLDQIVKTALILHLYSKSETLSFQPNFLDQRYVVSPPRVIFSDNSWKNHCQCPLIGVFPQLCDRFHEVQWNWPRKW